MVVAGSGFPEYGAQVLLPAFLQRAVNAGGHLTREHGPGRGRDDLPISWRKGREPQVCVIECKARRQRDDLDETILRGAIQAAGHAARSGAAEGHLPVCDRGERKSWEEEVFHRAVRVLRTGGASPDAEETGEILPEAAPPAPGERTIRVWGVRGPCYPQGLPTPRTSHLPDSRTLSADTGRGTDAGPTPSEAPPSPPGAGSRSERPTAGSPHSARNGQNGMRRMPSSDGPAGGTPASRRRRTSDRPVPADPQRSPGRAARQPRAWPRPTNRRSPAPPP